MSQTRRSSTWQRMRAPSACTTSRVGTPGSYEPGSDQSSCADPRAHAHQAEPLRAHAEAVVVAVGPASGRRARSCRPRPRPASPPPRRRRRRRRPRRPSPACPENSAAGVAPGDQDVLAQHAAVEVPARRPRLLRIEHVRRQRGEERPREVVVEEAGHRAPHRVVGGQRDPLDRPGARVQAREPRGLARRERRGRRLLPRVGEDDLGAVGVHRRPSVAVAHADPQVGAVHLLDARRVELAAQVVGAEHRTGARIGDRPAHVRGQRPQHAAVREPDGGVRLGRRRGGHPRGDDAGRPAGLELHRVPLLGALNLVAVLREQRPRRDLQQVLASRARGSARRSTSARPPSPAPPAPRSRRPARRHRPASSSRPGRAPARR